MSSILIPDHYDEKLTVIIAPRESKTGGLFLGNEDGARDNEMLKKKKVTAVLTISAEIEIKFTDRNHLHIKIYDSPFEDISQHFKRCFKFIQENIAKGNVFVHCQMGISRSATIVLGYLMKARGISLDKALEKVKNKRSIVRPNQGFIMQLKRLEEELAEAKSNEPKVHKPKVRRMSILK